jgi:hypothetical protein
MGARLQCKMWARWKCFASRAIAYSEHGGVNPESRWPHGRVSACAKSFQSCFFVNLFGFIYSGLAIFQSGVEPYIAVKSHRNNSRKCSLAEWIRK